MPNLQFDQRTKEDTIEIAELRIRALLESMSDDDDKYQAIRFICNGDRVKELLAFYLAVYETSPERGFGREAMKPDRLAGAVQRESYVATMARPAVFSDAVIANQEKFELTLAEALIEAIESVKPYRGTGERWDERSRKLMG